MPLEEALQAQEEKIDTLLKGATRYLSTLKGWKKACLPQHQSLASHDEVQTCQRATATVSLDGARIDMAPLTHLIIPAELPARQARARSRVLLLTGKILIWIVGSRPLEIGTAGAIAAAKSTQFIVSADDRRGPSASRQLGALDHLGNDTDPAEFAVLARQQEDTFLVPRVDWQRGRDAREDDRFIKWDQKKGHGKIQFL
jgi:hypothetical protein